MKNITIHNTDLIKHKIINLIYEIEICFSGYRYERNELEDMLLALGKLHYEINKVWCYLRIVKINFTEIRKFCSVDPKNEPKILNEIVKIIIGFDLLVNGVTFNLIFSEDKEWQKEVGDYFKERLQEAFSNNVIEIKINKE